MNDFMSLFTESYLRNALIGGLMTAGVCAYLGVYIIMKRIVFMSMALSSLSSLGIAVGMIAGLHPTIGSAVLTLIGISLFWFPFQEKNLSKESILGFTYAVTTSFAIILIAKNPMAEARGLNLLSGNLIYTNQADLLLIFTVVIFTGIVHFIFRKEFIFVSFDEETAYTTGLKVKRLSFLLYLTIGIAIGISMKTTGIIFVFASLIIPPMTALVISERIVRIFLYSVLITFLAVIAGFFASYLGDLPYSHTIVVIYGIVFLSVIGIRKMSHRPFA